MRIDAFETTSATAQDGMFTCWPLDYLSVRALRCFCVAATIEFRGTLSVSRELCKCHRGIAQHEQHRRARSRDDRRYGSHRGEARWSARQS